jgi:universal stress protein A
LVALVEVMRLRTLLVPIDFSSDADSAADVAVGLAARSGAGLALVHVEAMPLLATVAVEPMFIPPQWLEPLRRRHDDEVSSQLASVATALRARGVPVEEHVRLGDPAATICAAARELEADLIVMSTRGATATRFLLGSVAARVAQDAPCPVLVTRRTDERSPTRFRRVMVAVDYSRFSRQAAALGAVMVEPDGVLELAHVWHEPHAPLLSSHPERDALVAQGHDAARRRLAHFLADAELGHAGTELWVGTGSPSGALLDHVEESGVDLVIMGAHGRRGSARVLGTVADRVLRHASVSVLLVPDPDRSPAADDAALAAQ